MRLNSSRYVQIVQILWLKNSTRFLFYFMRFNFIRNTTAAIHSMGEVANFNKVSVCYKRYVTLRRRTKSLYTIWRYSNDFYIKFLQEVNATAIYSIFVLCN